MPIISSRWDASGENVFNAHFPKPEVGDLRIDWDTEIYMLELNEAIVRFHSLSTNISTLKEIPIYAPKNRILPTRC